MKIRFLKLKNCLLTGAMGLLGLSACHSHKELSGPTPDRPKDQPEIGSDIIVPMYGVPSTSYDLMTGNRTDSTVAEANVDLPRTDVNVPKPREPEVTVYGVPTVDYCVKGRVVDPKGKPVNGLQVILVNSNIDPDNLPNTPYWEEELRRLSDTTDAQGTFEVNGQDTPWEQMRVLVRDIDGAKNGSFESQLIEVEFGDAEQGDKPVSSWRLGTKSADITVKMKCKKK